MSWLERNAAATLFAKPPEATYDEAMEAFMKVEDLKPQVFKTNLLMVAKVSVKICKADSLLLLLLLFRCLAFICYAISLCVLEQSIATSMCKR